MVIYADLLLAVNWWVDFLLLVGVARFAGVSARAWRLVVGGLVGALSCGLLFLPPLSVWLSLGAKLAAATLMVLVAFGFDCLRQFGKRLLWLFGLSAGLSGLCSALYHFAAPRDFYVYNGVVYYAVSPWLLLGLTLVCYGILCGMEWVTRRRAPHQHAYTVRLTHGGRAIRVRCLYDSGNHLVEPFSGRSVVIVERVALASLLPVPTDVGDLPPNGLWRVVPFDTLGGSGLLPAFVPDSLGVITPQGEVSLGACYVAVCERLGRGEYAGLLGSAVGDYLHNGGKG